MIERLDWAKNKIKKESNQPPRSFPSLEGLSPASRQANMGSVRVSVYDCSRVCARANPVHGKESAQFST